MLKSDNTHPRTVVRLGRLSLCAAALLACVPAFSQADPWRNQTRVMIEYVIPFSAGSAKVQQTSTLGFTVAHAMNPLAFPYANALSNRVPMVDIRFDPEKRTLTRFGLAGIDFSPRLRVNAVQGDNEFASTEWTPANILAGVAITGGVLALLLHEAAKVQTPGCTIANVNFCKP